VADIDDVSPHLQQEDRDRERQTDPEPPRHVPQFRALASVSSRDHRLERHAADGTAPRPHLADLRMHRAGVLDALATVDDCSANGCLRHRRRSLLVMVGSSRMRRPVFLLHRVLLFSFQLRPLGRAKRHRLRL